jgi:glutathione synthase/RimK-type ligase-like ATP-grasp enzyme
MHAIASRVFRGADITQLGAELQRRAAEGKDAAAMFDLATLLQSHGRTEEALQLLHEALRLRRDFCVVHGNGSGLRLLAFMAPGDFMANTPLDFLLSGSDAVLWLRYVDVGTTGLADLPDHDVAFMAIGQSNDHGPILEHMRRLLADFPGPVMNNDPMRIDRLTRDAVSAMLAGEPSILAPATHRVSRRDLQAVAAGTKRLGASAPGVGFPIIARPVGTHAGHGLARLNDLAELSAWLDAQPAAELYVTPFVDYRGADGLFGKQRVVFIQGKAFASHLALSEHWIVHYLSAGMAESAEKRAVEQGWMENFDTDFAIRHGEAFAALYRHIGLDYFGIDCAELPDGRLLVFEVDVAMVIHDMDSAETYPYKKLAMRKLFDAFIAAARGKAASAIAR